MFRAIFRMKLGVKEWAKHLVIKHALIEKIEEQKKQKLADDGVAETQSKATGWAEDTKAEAPQPKKTKPISRKGYRQHAESNSKATSKKTEMTQSRTNDEWLAETHLSGTNAFDFSENIGAMETQTTDGWTAESDAHHKEPRTHLADDTTTELTLGNPMPGEILARMKRQIASQSVEKESKNPEVQNPNDNSEANLQIKIEIRLPKTEREADEGGKRKKRNIMLTYDAAKYRGGIDRVVTEDLEADLEELATTTDQSAPKAKLTAAKPNRKPATASEFDISKPSRQTVISDTDNTDHSLVISKTVKRKSSKRRSSSAMATQSDLARLIASRKANEAGYDIRSSPPKRSASRRNADLSRD